MGGRGTQEERAKKNVKSVKRGRMERMKGSLSRGSGDTIRIAQEEETKRSLKRKVEVLKKRKEDTLSLSLSQGSDESTQSSLELGGKQKRITRGGRENFAEDKEKSIKAKSRRYEDAS